MDKNYPLLQQRKMYLSLNNVADLFFLKSKKNRFQLSNYLTIALIAFLYLGFNDIHAQTISLKTSKELYVDKDWDNSPPGNLGPHATYIAYEFCNNTGSVTANLTATVTVSGTGYSLAGGQAATQTIGNLGVGKCVTLYWFVGYPHLINQNATVSVSLVENGSSIIGTVSDVITTKEASPDSKAGLLNTKTLSSDNGIGQVTNFDVEYVFGDVKEEEKITFQPAGNIDFEAGCFQLIGTEILTSVYACIPVGSKNRLNYTITEDCDRSGSNNKIKVRYYFLNKCIGATSAIQPYSGRHKEDGKYEYSKNFDTNQDANGNPLPTIVFAETQNHFTVTKTALPANITSLPAQVTYTVSITNNSETSANIDGIDDLLSLPLSFNAIHGSSEINTGNATSLPTLGATGHLRFIGGSSATSYPFKEFAFEPNQTINLVYTVNLAKNTPNAVYSNITKIFVGEYESEGVNVDITVSDGEPVAVNDTCGTNEDTATTTTNVLLNDTVIDYATITNYTTTSTKGGTVLYNNDGTFKYTPLANFNGTDTFTYTLCDDDSTPNCSTATVTITVSPVNDLPISVNDTAANILEDSGLINIKVLVNDSFGGDGPSTGSIIVTPIASTIGTAVLQNNDTPNNPTDDSIDFTPALNYHGPVSINYTIYDLDGDASSATVTFNVTSVNDLPVAKADIESMFENTTLNKNVFGNDTLSGDGGNIFALVSGVSNGTLTFNNDGTYSYSPNLNYNGNDSFQYKITDVDGDTSTTTVSITITDSGNPIAKPDTYNTPEDTNFITGNVLSNDEVLDGATITNFDATTTKGGTVSYNGNGTFNYAPALNFYGTDTFTYSLCDKDVPTPSCSTATVTINVASVNDAPTAVNDSKTGNEDTIITLNVTTNDSDLDGSINVATVDLNTSLAGIQNTITISGKGTFTVNPSGLVTFTPVANYYGVVTTNYNVQDNNGATSNNATITITVTSVNDVPVAANDTNSTNEDTSKTGNVATNDTPSGDGGNVWSLVGSNGGASNGTVTMTTAGNYTYTPNLSFSGIDSFTYQIKDVDGDITTATVTMTVIDRGNPVAVNDLVEVTENKTITTQNVLTNDSMIDGATFSSFEYTGGNGATISYNNNGTFTYTPSSNFYGIDTFTYTICDNDPTPSCSTTTVLVTVLIDSDDDGLADIHDFDDDNDGILDTVESAIDCDFYPTLSFVNPVLISGTTRQVGAVYRFSNVTVSGNTNLDCFVTIASSTGTGNVVDNFDVTSTDPVVNARFQPILRANVAQVNFNFKFVVSGTTTPFNIPQFYATGIDIDGNETQEYDIVGSNNYAVDSPTNIIITSTTSSTKFKGPSASYVSGANGIDDSVTIVMATVKYQERSEMNLNIGSSPTATNARQFAISFDPCFYFIYKNSTKVSEDLFYSDLDTDGDGIPNRLDLDSDNDGCSDALEAGSTTDTTVNYKFPTSPVGTDGVPDAVQVNNGSNSRLVDYTVIKTIPTGKFDFLDASVNVGCKADLSVTKTVNNTSPEIGDTVLFSIVLHNAGPYSTDGIKVKDILPTSLTYNSSNSVIPAGTTFDNATGIWDLSGYTMEVNSSIELKIAATVLSTCSLVTNTAEIITSEKTDPDSTPNNNVSTEDDYSEASLTVVDTTPPAFNSPLPADVTVECSAIPVAPTLTATDNCGSATVNLNTTSTKTNNGSCNDSSYTITRTWTATDCCGINTITHTQTITVQDTTAPIISAAPADASYQCLAEVPAAGNLTATDNCTSEFSVAGVDNINNDNPNETIITRTWTASDLCNNTSSVSQKITIRDTINPTIVCPDNITVNVDGDACGTDASNVILGTPIYNDNCSVATIDNDAPSSFPIGNTTVTWTVRDAAGNTATCEQTVTVVDNIKPVITECPATVSVTVDADACEVLASNVTLGTPTFTDNCPNTTITNDAPTSFPIGDTTVTWTVTDAAGNEATCIQTVTVTDNIKPVITECPATVSVSVDADACEVLASNVTLGTPTFTDNCPNTTITNDAPTSFPIGDTTVTWTVTDAAGNTATCEQTVTVVDNIKPIITECPATVSIPVDADACEVLASNVTLGTPTFTDNCPNTTITNDAPTSFPIGDTTVTWTVTDAAGNTATCTQTVTVVDNIKPVITECPAKVSVNVAADACEVLASNVTLGTPTFTDNCPNATITNDAPASFPIGDTTVTWTVTDAAGNTATCTQTVTVTDNIKPVITECPATVSVPVDADACEVLASNVTLGTPTFTDNCPNATITNDAPSSFPIGNTTVTWTVKDAAGNEATCIQTVTVTDNIKPVITECPATVSVPVDADACEVLASNVTLGTPTFTDNCPNATITNDAPASFPIGDTTVTWTVTDAAGNEATCIQTVTVTDNIKPVITECPATVSVSVDADACEVLASNVTLGTPTFTDNCPNTTITNDAPASFPIGDTTVTWTVTDAAGNEATCIQTVTVTDNIKPVITECPATVSVPVDADTCEVLASNVTLGTLTFTDNCPNATITNDAPASFPIGNTTVTWTVTDAAGNTATCTQTVTVIDLHSPKFVEALPVDGTFECDEIPEPAILSAIDNCGTVNVNFSEIRIDGDCTNSYIIQRTWTAKDDGGLTATHTQLITVQDTKAPELVSNLQTSLTANCESIPEVPQLEFSDNCSTDINVDFIETSTYSTSNSNYEIVRTWTVSDTCENEAIFKQTIAVTLNNLVSQVSDRVCIDDGVVNLDDYLPNNQLNGSWVVLEGSTQLNDNIFDTDNIALGNYKFSYTTSFNGCLHTIELSIDVHDECVVYPCGQEDVEISKVITPNGDSRNEFFEVTGIESCNFVIEIQIFNRWGAKIYENSNYKNDWNGFAHNSSVGKADKVPNGTYYYIINLKNSGLKPFAKAFYVGTK